MHSIPPPHPPLKISKCLQYTELLAFTQLKALGVNRKGAEEVGVGGGK